MENSEGFQQFYKRSFDDYFATFSGMSDAARSMWFFVAEESVILSFDVGDGETVQHAEMRHAVKLQAMADALEALPNSADARDMIADLRRLVLLHRTAK